MLPASDKSRKGYQKDETKSGCGVKECLIRGHEDGTLGGPPRSYAHPSARRSLAIWTVQRTGNPPRLII